MVVLSMSKSPLLQQLAVGGSGPANIRPFIDVRLGVRTLSASVHGSHSPSDGKGH